MIFIKHTPEFKIRTKNDVNTFLQNCLKGTGSVSVSVDKHHCFFIIRNNALNFIEITEKIGNLQDIFNPELVIPDEQMVDYIWKMRKYINKRWFNN